METLPSEAEKVRERQRRQRIYDRVRQTQARMLTYLALSTTVGDSDWLRRLRRDTVINRWWQLGTDMQRPIA